MYFRLLHDETSGAVRNLPADLDTGDALSVDPRGAVVPVLVAMLDEQRLQRRWHPWFGGASRDEFLARVQALPASLPITMSSTHDQTSRLRP